MENAIKILTEKASALQAKFGVECAVKLDVQSDGVWYHCHIGNVMARHRGSSANRDLDSAISEAIKNYMANDPLEKLEKEAAASGYKLVKLEN
jgi:hypothetical protein